MGSSYNCRGGAVHDHACGISGTILRLSFVPSLSYLEFYNALRGAREERPVLAVVV